jgi:hypothetical protein
MRTRVVSGFQWLLLLLFLLVASPTASAAYLPAHWRWSNPSPHGGNIFDMTYGFGLTVAVTERGQIFSSEDLRFWQPRESGTTNSLRAVTFLGRRLIITGERGTVLYADSLEDFHFVNLNTPDWLEGVAASTNLLVAVGDRGAIYTSTNGTNWQRRTTSITNWLRGVAYGSGLFVAVGENGLIATSPNGSTWTKQSSPTSRHLNRVSLIQDKFWAVGDNGVTIVSPPLGIGLWTTVASGATDSLFSASSSPNTRLLVGNGEVRLRDSNLNWSNQRAVPSYPAPDWTFYNALWQGSLYFVSGRSGMVIEGFQTNSSSPWLWINRTDSIRNWLWELQFISDFYITVGYFGTVMTSINGIDWDLELVPNSVTNSTFLGVGGTTNLLLAVGDKGTLIFSPNTLTNLVFTNSDGSFTTNQASTLGIVWNALQPRPTTNDLQGVTVLSNQFVVTGGNGTVLTSSDGTNWTLRPTGSSSFLSGIAAFPDGAVAVGSRGTILSSSNAVSWRTRTSGTTNWIYRVRYLGGRLIAVGQNGTILTSSDGATWTPRASGTTRWLNDVKLLDDTYFIVGNQGTLLFSTNTVNWASIGTITEKSLYGLAHNGRGQLVVAGVEGAIIRSQTVPDLSPVHFLNFARDGTQNLYLLSGKPDQRFHLDRSSSLTNWSRGPLLEFLDSSGTLLFLENTGTNAPPRAFYRTTLAD